MVSFRLCLFCFLEIRTGPWKLNLTRLTSAFNDFFKKQNYLSVAQMFVLIVFVPRSVKHYWLLRDFRS